MTQINSRKNYILEHSVALRQNLRNVTSYTLPIFVFTILCYCVMWADSNKALLAAQSQSNKPQFQTNVVDVTDNKYNKDNDNSQEISIQDDNSNKKPIMYTFWESVPGGCCGADEKGHQELLDSWRNAWGTNGWETRLLSMEDSKKHPDYQRMEDSFNGKKISEYDKRCFYRWLAMGTLPNGGWISDYDMFPLHFTGKESFDLVRENDNGRFTSYAYTAPALIYASREEWQRMINMLIEAIPPFEGLLTDMYVFKKLVETDKEAVGIVYDPDKFASRLGFMNYVERGKLSCQSLKGQKAVHFSHYRTSVSFETGVYPLVEVSPIQERGKAAAIMMNDYEKQCIQSSTT